MAPSALPVEVSAHPVPTQPLKSSVSTSDRVEHVSAAYRTLEASYISSNPTSQSLYDRATASLPGGNTRSVLFYPPFPISVASARGAHLTSADGETYVDLLGEYTAGLYGHSNEVILETIHATLDRGIGFGSHHADEARLAGLIKERFAGMDLVRFTNSGTEANLMAMAAAKAFTGRMRGKILVFDGAYHGGVFSFGGGRSASVNVPHDWIIGQYNSTSHMHSIFSEHGEDIAAVVVEPMIGSGGCIPAKKEWLQLLRRKTQDVGAVLIFDEVMTSRLYDGGGIQTEFDITPDLTALGKYIGGGMSFGAFGGKREIMSMFDPRTGKLSHAGTFNNNVLTMAAGATGLEKVFTQEAAADLQEKGDRLRARLNEVGEGTLMKVTGCGSIMCFHFTSTEVEDLASPEHLRDNVSGLNDLIHLYLLSRKFYIARRGFLALSLALSEDELEAFVGAVRGFVDEYRDLL